MSFQPKSATILSASYGWAQFAPHTALSAWISSYWTLETGGGAHVVRTLPDGCVDVTLRLDGEPGAFLAAPHPRAQEWAFEGRRQLVGARMLPGAAALLGVDVEALGEGWTPLDAYMPKPKVARLVRAASTAAHIEGRIAALDAFFTEHLLNRELDVRLAKALRLVFAASGDVTIADLARAAGAHARTLTRLFERFIGLGPKRFARIVRVQAALRALPEGEGAAHVALALGYCDQAHFVREVRELFGVTPSEALNLAGRTR
jgi:AraC-like DNA-binding protein